MKKDIYIIENDISDEKIEKIKTILKTTYHSYDNIAKQCGVECRVVSRINRGIFHYSNKETYPIREGKINRFPLKFTYEDVTKINDLLMNTDLSLREIARQFNVEYVDIQNIKNGTKKIYKRKGLTYPLRENN